MKLSKIITLNFYFLALLVIVYSMFTLKTKGLPPGLETLFGFEHRAQAPIMPKSPFK